MRRTAHALDRSIVYDSSREAQLVRVEELSGLIDVELARSITPHSRIQRRVSQVALLSAAIALGCSGERIEKAREIGPRDALKYDIVEGVCTA